MPGVTRARFSAMSVSVLMAMPGAISTTSDACPSRGKNPWATVCRNPASCGCNTSMNVSARSSIGERLPARPTPPYLPLGASFRRKTQLAARVILDLAEPAHFDLPDALACQVQNGADFFQRDATAIRDVERAGLGHLPHLQVRKVQLDRARLRIDVQVQVVRAAHERAGARHPPARLT